MNIGKKGKVIRRSSANIALKIGRIEVNATFCPAKAA
jgi:hypothetical protein